MRSRSLLSAIPLSTACLAAAALLSCAGEIVEVGTEEGDPSIYSELNVWQDLRFPNSLGIPANDGPRRDGTLWSPDSNPTPAEYVPGSAACGDIPAACNGTNPLDILASPDTCGSGGCHGSPGDPAAASVDFGSDQTDLIVNLAQTQGTGACAGYPLIDGATPIASLLLNKIGGAPVCGLPMPVAPKTISQEQINCLIAWVVQDATECL